MYERGDNLVIFYYLSASKIWPKKRGGLIREVLLFYGDMAEQLILFVFNYYNFKEQQKKHSELLF
jgi:hypothetical protein